jgi:hypothetical protein
MADLKPCPFCSSTELEMQLCGIQHMAVVCKNCLAVGPRQAINKELAVRASIDEANTRAVIAWELRFGGDHG